MSNAPLYRIGYSSFGSGLNSGTSNPFARAMELAGKGKQTSATLTFKTDNRLEDLLGSAAAKKTSTQFQVG